MTCHQQLIAHDQIREEAAIHDHAILGTSGPNAAGSERTSRRTWMTLTKLSVLAEPPPLTGFLVLHHVTAGRHKRS